jgi:hypothetical protein
MYTKKKKKKKRGHHVRERAEKAVPLISPSITSFRKSAEHREEERKVSLAESSVAPQQIERRDNAYNDAVKKLQAICTDADPTRLYTRSLVQIGQE